MAAIPHTIPEWRWTGLVYFGVVAQWPFTTTACRRIAALAKEHIRSSVVAAVTPGEDVDSDSDSGSGVSSLGGSR